jgi:hypothetical protein
LFFSLSFFSLSPLSCTSSRDVWSCVCVFFLLAR